MPSNHLCRPLLLPPSIIPGIRVFSDESALRIRWPKYWSFSFSNSPSNEYSGLISFRMDWLDLLAVQGTLQSLLQHHSSKASIFWRSAFFIVQLSHPYMTTGKLKASTRRTFVGKVMSLLWHDWATELNWCCLSELNAPGQWVLRVAPVISLWSYWAKWHHRIASSLLCAPWQGTVFLLFPFPFVTRDSNHINGLMVGNPKKGDELLF